MKKTLILVIIVSVAFLSFAMNRTPIQPNKMEEKTQDSTCYYLDDYLICPHSKEVKYMIRVGGVDWDGYDYVVDSTINYDKTQLIIIEGKVFFKEYLTNVEIENLRVLETEKIHDRLYTKVTDGDNIYELSNTILYPTNPYNAEDESTDNALISNDKVIKRGKTYTAYDDSIIVISNYKAKRIDLDISKTKEYLIDNYYNTYLITDGNRTYLHSLFYQGKQLMELDFLRGKDVTAIAGKVHPWNISEPDQTIYMTVSKTDKAKMNYPPETIGWQGLLLSTTDGYYIVTRDGLYKKADHFRIVNENENGFEEYNPNTMQDRIMILNLNYYIQNSKLYGYNYLVSNQDSIEANKLYHLESENIQTEFYTDGNILIDLGDTSGIATRDEELVMEGKIISGVDLESLIVINSNTLKDKNNFYRRSHNKIEVIPLDKLGIPVHIISIPQTSQLIR